MMMNDTGMILRQFFTVHQSGDFIKKCSREIPVKCTTAFVSSCPTLLGTDRGTRVHVPKPLSSSTVCLKETTEQRVQLLLPPLIRKKTYGKSVSST
jgi:hypothetical protein